MGTVVIPDLETTARLCWELEARQRFDVDAAEARRWAFARYWQQTRRPGADGGRVIWGPPRREGASDD